MPHHPTNPPADEVFAQCFEAIARGAGVSSLTADVRQYLRNRLEEPFQRELAKENAWTDSSANLLRAAAATGQIAMALATFEGRPDIAILDVQAAVDLIETRCTNRYGHTGQWCN